MSHKRLNLWSRKWGITQQKEKKELGISTQRISLGSLIIKFRSESVVQLPKSGSLCADVRVIKEIKDCEHKISAEKGPDSRGDASSSRRLCVGKRTETGLTSGWWPEEQRRRESGGPRPDRCAYHLSACIRARARSDVSVRSSHCFKTFIIGERRSVRINAPTEDSVGQLFNGIIITRSLGREVETLPRVLSFSFSFAFLFRLLFICAFPIFVIHPPSFIRFVLCIFCPLPRCSLLDSHRSLYSHIHSFLLPSDYVTLLL